MCTELEGLGGKLLPVSHAGSLSSSSKALPHGFTWLVLKYTREGFFLDMDGFYADGVVTEGSQTLQGVREFVFPFSLAPC